MPTSTDVPLLGQADGAPAPGLARGLEESELRALFFLMSGAVGVNHAAVTTPIGYASTVLAPAVGDCANSLLFGTSIVCSLLAAPVAMLLLGPKMGLLAGMSAYTIYVWCFAAATMACEVRLLTEQQCGLGGPAQWTWASAGSILGGVGAGLLWPCQGVLFVQLSRAMSESRLAGGAKATAAQDTTCQVTAEYSSIFACVFMSMEFIAKAMFTVLQFFGMPAGVVFQVYGCFALGSTLVFGLYFHVAALISGGRQVSYSCVSSRQHAEPSANWLDVIRQWRDPKLSLLMFTNVAFGFSTGWVNSYVNGNLLAGALRSKDFIGLLGAFTAVIAAVSSEAYGLIATRYGKPPVIFFGSVCFFGIGMLSVVFSLGGEFTGWGSSILLFYLLQGLGRGVYESTNKGMFADFFPDDSASPAFANVMVQSSLSASVSFTLLGMHAARLTLWLLLLSAALTFPCLSLATRLLERERKAARAGEPGGGHQPQRRVATREGWTMVPQTKGRDGW